MAMTVVENAGMPPMETFIVTYGERHPTYLAGLRGARLVAAQQTEQGRRWAESKVKALTGGDPISARFMRQDFFTFQPAFKLWIAGNHKPSLTGVDVAIRRRFRLLPFTVTIAKPDLELPDKLRAEWPGILQWMIEGCRQWLETGLNPPSAVQAATELFCRPACRRAFSRCPPSLGTRGHRRGRLERRSESERVRVRRSSAPWDPTNRGNTATSSEPAAMPLDRETA